MRHNRDGRDLGLVALYQHYTGVDVYSAEMFTLKLMLGF